MAFRTDLILSVSFSCSLLFAEPEDEDVMDYVEEEEVEEAQPTARPKRMSELRSSVRVKPLPTASSFFIFSHKNRYNDPYHITLFTFTDKNPIM